MAPDVGTDGPMDPTVKYVSDHFFEKKTQKCLYTLDYIRLIVTYEKHIY